MNHELYDKFKSPDITTVIKACRLEQWGLVVIMGGGGTVK